MPPERYSRTAREVDGIIELGVEHCSLHFGGCAAQGDSATGETHTVSYEEHSIIRRNVIEIARGVGELRQWTSGEPEHDYFRVAVRSCTKPPESCR